VSVQLKKFVAARRRRLRDAMARQSLDALVVVDPADVSYLTGFGGEDSVLVLTPRRQRLVTDARFPEQIKQECPTLPFYLRQGAMSEAVATVLAPMRAKTRQPWRIGIEADHVSVSHYRAYRRAIGKELHHIKPLVAPLRQCKDDYELRQLRKAVKLAQEGMQALHRWAQLGMTERQLAGRLEYEMASRGSTEAAFPTIAAVGPHAAQAHAIPARHRWRAHQPILFDWGATVNGYRSDLTRCYVAGTIRPTFAEAYQWVLEAQLAAINKVTPGVPLCEVDDAARKVLRRSPWPLYGHGTGHGIGLRVHEAPAVSARSQQPCQEGMVITIEPGIYVPGRFGIRIEDDVLVTANGAKVLSTLGKGLASVTLDAAMRADNDRPA